jgi:hypothetical protein
MKLSTRKIVLGAALAISLGGLTLPAGASVAPIMHRNNDATNRKYVGVQMAQVGREADEKADEVESGTRGAVNAVDAAHRRHERNEYRHRTIGSKLDSKIEEGKEEVKGAGHAMERAHERHEAVEHSEGRD